MILCHPLTVNIGIGAPPDKGGERRAARLWGNAIFRRQGSNFGLLAEAVHLKDDKLSTVSMGWAGPDCDFAALAALSLRKPIMRAGAK